MDDRSWGQFKTVGECAGRDRATSPFSYVLILIGLALGGALLAVAVYVLLVFRFGRFTDLKLEEFKRYMVFVAAAGGAYGLAAGVRYCLQWHREEVELREKRRRSS